MSACEDRVISNTLQCDDARILEDITVYSVSGD